jgi:hypothetical protein
MARRLRDKSGAIVAIELTDKEMSQALDIELEDLRAWTNAIPVYARSGENTLYRVHDVKELNHLKKRVALLRTRMSEKAVANVEEAGLLDSYAALAEDCPKGLTAHVWRSYALVVLMQVRYGKMIDVQELAERAGLVTVDKESGEPRPDISMAAKHLRLLQSVDGGYLKVGTDKWSGQWEHQGLPKSWRGV